jgi:hypothetical protein
MSHRLAAAMVSAAALALASCGGSLTPVVPPADLTYSENPATYPVGIPITPNTPSTSGGAVESYAVLPALPPGLALDPGTGVITGTLTAASARASYSVFAANAGGITATAVSIGTDPQQVTVTVMQSNGPNSGATVVESSGILFSDGTAPPSPTGVIDTRITNDAGKATFTVPESTPTGEVCFSSRPTSGIYSGFTSRCMLLTGLEPTALLFHF